MIKTTLMSSCRWKTLVPFLLAKEKNWKRTINLNSELSQNRTEKQIMPFKTTVNWQFNMWCHWVISFLIEKLVFQQTVVTVYSILNSLSFLFRLNAVIGWQLSISFRDSFIAGKFQCFCITLLMFGQKRF